MLVYQQAFYVLIGLGILIGFPAFWLFARGMWPAKVEKAREAASRSFVLNFILGVPVVTAVIVLLTRAGKINQVAGSIAGFLSVLALFWALIGMAGLASHIGARLWPAFTGADGWRAQLRGGLVIAGSLTIPFVGWFLLPLVLIAVGAGIRVRMWFLPRALQPVVQPLTAPVPPPGAPAPAMAPATPEMPQPPAMSQSPVTA
jgi:hypothetical protein